MAKLVYEAVAIVGEKKDGGKLYHKLGAVFESEKGLSLKIDSIPVGGTWNGWVSFFAPKPKDGQAAPARRTSQTPPPPRDDFEDEPPF